MKKYGSNWGPSKFNSDKNVFDRHSVCRKSESPLTIGRVNQLPDLTWTWKSWTSKSWENGDLTNASATKEEAMRLCDEVLEQAGYTYLTPLKVPMRLLELAADDIKRNATIAMRWLTRSKIIRVEGKDLKPGMMLWQPNSSFHKLVIDTAKIPVYPGEIANFPITSMCVTFKYSKKSPIGMGLTRKWDVVEAEFADKMQVL
jgi:hypothetical protein